VRPPTAERAQVTGAELTFFLIFLCFLDFHVTEFIRVEDFAALLALDIFGVLIARDYAHSWMFAGGVHDGHLGAEIQVVSARLYPGQHFCQFESADPAFSTSVNGIYA
jgi:hypothetical protein